MLGSIELIVAELKVRACWAMTKSEGERKEHWRARDVVTKNVGMFEWGPAFRRGQNFRAELEG